MTDSKLKFLWGAATSAYQVEGGISNNDWDYFVRSDPIKKRISSLTKPSIFYKGRTQIHLESAGEAVKFWKLSRLGTSNEPNYTHKRPLHTMLT